MNPGTLKWATHLTSLSLIYVIYEMKYTSTCLVLSQVGGEDSGWESPFPIFKDTTPYVCITTTSLKSSTRTGRFRLITQDIGIFIPVVPCRLCLGFLCYTDFTSKMQFSCTCQVWALRNFNL